MTRAIRLFLMFVVGATVLAACGTSQQPAVEFDLEVEFAGTGTGVLTSVPAGIDTSTGGFDAAFTSGTVVTLTAQATGGSSFTGFSFPAGATYECEESSTATTCVLTMDEDKSVIASFAAPTPTANLVVTAIEGGVAEGSVVSSPAGINSATGATTATFDVGTVVTLTATVTTPHFAGWTGGQCDGIKELTCVLTVVASQPAIAANFNDAATLSLQIAAVSDTAEEFLDDSLSDSTRWPVGHTYTFSNDLEFAYDPTHGPQAIGLRFTGVTIPTGAIVLDATIGLTAYANPNTGTSTDVALTITGEAATDSATFTGDPNEIPGPNPSSFGVTTLDRTAARVSWTITETWTADVEYDSADTAAIVQEIIDLAGWTSGGSLIFIIEPVDDTSTALRRAYASGTVDKAPTLSVTYVPLPLP